MFSAALLSGIVGVFELKNRSAYDRATVLALEALTCQHLSYDSYNLVLLLLRTSVNIVLSIRLRAQDERLDLGRRRWLLERDVHCLFFQHVHGRLVHLHRFSVRRKDVFGRHGRVYESKDDEDEGDKEASIAI
jgi:hypothetical protein